MEKEKILEENKKKKTIVGEMEKEKMGKGNYISVLVAGIIGVIFMIVEGILGHHTAQFAVGAVIFAWASTFYACQYFIAKRPWQVLIGAVLEFVGFVLMITFFILFNVKGW